MEAKEAVAIDAVDQEVLTTVAVEAAMSRLGRIYDNPIDPIEHAGALTNYGAAWVDGFNVAEVFSSIKAALLKTIMEQAEVTEEVARGVLKKKTPDLLKNIVKQMKNLSDQKDKSEE